MGSVAFLWKGVGSRGRNADVVSIWWENEGIVQDKKN